MTGMKLQVATRGSLSDTWSESIVFDDIHINGYIDAFPSLSPDELTMYYRSDMYTLGGNRIWMATRSSINEQFSNPTLVSGLDIGNYVSSPCILPDGLTIYFSQKIDGQFDLYRATRDFTSDPFGNIELLSLSIPIGNEISAYVPADESEIYFTS